MNTTMTQGPKQEPKLVCPRCRATKRIWRKGVVPTRTGQKPRFTCFKCGKTFYSDANPPDKRRQEYKCPAACTIPN